jgi:hypothetical protein
MGFRECIFQYGHPSSGSRDLARRIRTFGIGGTDALRPTFACSPVSTAVHIPVVYRQKRNNNNTFTWSGPSGVPGCTVPRPLGRVAGKCSQGDGCRAVPLNAAESDVARNLRGGKDYDSGLRKGCNMQRTYPV